MSSAAHEWSGEVEDLDPAAILAALKANEIRLQQGEVDKLRLALQWCAGNPPDTKMGFANWGDYTCLDGAFDDDESLGGDGTPAVAAFAAESVATTLGVSAHAGMQLIADALDLAHRLPLIWARVQTLGVPVWRARKAAEATHSLSQEAAAHVDAQLVGRIHSAGLVLMKRLVAEAAAQFDPEEQKTAEEQAVADSGVELRARVGFGYAGSSELYAVGDTVDLTLFYDRVNELAAQLAEEGDDSPLGVRRIRAMRVLAGGDDSRLDLEDVEASTTGLSPSGSSGRHLDEADTAHGRPAAGMPGAQQPAGGPFGSPSARSAGDPRRGPGATRLILNLDATALDGEPLARVGTVERLGPITLAKIITWLGRTDVTVTPVIREGRTDAVDVHDPPWWMAEQVIVRDKTCRFPYCERDARTADLDHIEPYDKHGPPGQTNPENLAPLCRRHHRAKTSRRWRYERRPDGSYRWHGPWNSEYLVTPLGTNPVPRR